MKRDMNTLHFLGWQAGRCLSGIRNVDLREGAIDTSHDRVDRIDQWQSGEVAGQDCGTGGHYCPVTAGERRLAKEASDCGSGSTSRAGVLQYFSHRQTAGG